MIMAVQKRAASKKNPVKKAPAKKSTAKKSFDCFQKKITRASVKRPGSGGARKGSGRKVGAATKKTREIADRLAASDEISPLEYMLETLRETPDKLRKMYADGDIDTVEYTLRLQELTKRRDKAAVDACPFLHPRLSAITADVNTNSHDRWIMLMEGKEI
jgi:hypothetical protein